MNIYADIAISIKKGDEMINVLAVKTDRQNKLKWYEFYKKNNPEIIELCAYGQSLAVYYEKTEIKPAEKYIKSVNNEICDSRIITGKNVFNGMIPDIVKKIRKAKNLTLKSKVAIFGSKCDSVYTAVSDFFCANYSFVVLINDDNLAHIEEAMLDEYGILVDIARSSDKVKCDLAIILDEREYRINKKATVIQFGRTKTEVEIKDSIPPFIDSVSLYEALALSEKPVITKILL